MFFRYEITAKIITTLGKDLLKSTKSARFCKIDRDNLQNCLQETIWLTVINKLSIMKLQ